MNIREWLKETYKRPAGSLNADLRPRITCADGFSMEVQASMWHYCVPMKSMPDGDYISVEVRYPTDKDPLLEQRGSWPVYQCVPVDVVDEVLEKHGGILWPRA